MNKAGDTWTMDDGRTMTCYDLTGAALKAHIKRLIRTADPRCPKTSRDEILRLKENPLITQVYVDDNDDDLYEEV